MDELPFSARRRITDQGPAMGKTRRLLIVDDSIELVEAAGAAMEARGFEVNRASNAFAGVRIAATDPPDAIVMDLDMPGMDGIEAALYLKRIDQTRDIPVIAFTGQSLESIAAPATRSFSRIISKASGFDVLEREIDALLGDPR
jgi:CheY-like chemotaxis protein